MLKSDVRMCRTSFVKFESRFGPQTLQPDNFVALRASRLYRTSDLLLFGAPLLVVKVKAALLSRVTPSQPYSIYLFEQKVHSVSL